jgi:hypothetical protein
MELSGRILQGVCSFSSYWYLNRCVGSDTSVGHIYSSHRAAGPWRTRVNCAYNHVIVAKFIVSLCHAVLPRDRLTAHMELYGALGLLYRTLALHSREYVLIHIEL